MVYFNLDWAQDLKSHKSVTGYFTLMTHKVKFWISHQQKTVALSLTKCQAWFTLGVKVHKIGLEICGLIE